MNSREPDNKPSNKKRLVALIAILAGGALAALSIHLNWPAILPVFGMMLLFYGVLEGVSCISGKTEGHGFSSMYSIPELDDLPDAQKMPPTQTRPTSAAPSVETRFCPYCGAPAESDYVFCRSCGKKLPD